MLPLRELRAITILLGIIVVFVLGVVLYQLSSVLLPFIVALLLSFIFKPLVLWLTRRKVPMGVALLAVVLAVGGLFLLLALIITPSIDAFRENLPQYEARLTTLTNDVVGWGTEMAARVGLDVSEFAASDIVQTSTITGILGASLGGLITGLSNAFLVVLFLLFLLAGSGELGLKIQYAFTERNADRLSSIVENIDRQVRQYMVTKTLISLGTGALTTIILLILEIDFAVVWGLLTFLLNYIPNIGSLLATILPVLTAFVQYDSLTRPLLALVLLVVGQNIMGNVVEPKMMQFSLNLSAVLILVSLIFWGWLWGIWGMILAVPITATVKIICENVDALRPIAVLMSGRVQEGARPVGTDPVGGPPTLQPPA